MRRFYKNVGEVFRSYLEIEKVPGAKKPQAVLSKMILREPCATFAEDKCYYNSPCLANRLHHISFFRTSRSPMSSYLVHDLQSF